MIGILPSLDTLALPDGLVEWLRKICCDVGYFLPMKDFFIMFSIWFLITNFKIVWKVVQRVWDALPFT